MLVTIPQLAGELKVLRGHVGLALKFLSRLGCAEPTKPVYRKGPGRPPTVWEINVEDIPEIKGTALQIAERFCFPSHYIHAALRAMSKMGIAKRIDIMDSGAILWRVGGGRETNAADGDGRLLSPGIPGA